MEKFDTYRFANYPRARLPLVIKPINHYNLTGNNLTFAKNTESLVRPENNQSLLLDNRSNICISNGTRKKKNNSDIQNSSYELNQFIKTTPIIDWHIKSTNQTYGNGLLNGTKHEHAFSDMKLSDYAKNSQSSSIQMKKIRASSTANISSLAMPFVLKSLASTPSAPASLNLSASTSSSSHSPHYSNNSTCNTICHASVNNNNNVSLLNRNLSNPYFDYNMKCNNVINSTKNIRSIDQFVDSPIANNSMNDRKIPYIDEDIQVPLRFGHNNLCISKSFPVISSHLSIHSNDKSNAFNSKSQLLLESKVNQTSQNESQLDDYDAMSPKSTTLNSKSIDIGTKAVNRHSDLLASPQSLNHLNRKLFKENVAPTTQNKLKDQSLESENLHLTK